MVSRREEAEGVFGAGSAFDPHGKQEADDDCNAVKSPPVRLERVKCNCRDMDVSNESRSRCGSLHRLGMELAV
jgi:hypothetical protein